MPGMDQKKSIEVIRSGNNVRRFHTLPLLVGETVGHHSANVALLCHVLTEGHASADLLLAALTHDLDEQYTGDVPAPAKWANPDLKKELEKTGYQMTPPWAIPIPDLTQYEMEVLKAADMLDLCYKCLEEIELGNRGMRKILFNGINYLSGLQLQGGAQRMLNHILEELRKR